MHTRLLIIATALLLTASAAQAQTQVEINKPFSVQADHDGKDTAGYRVYIDGVKVGTDQPTSILAAGVLTVAMQGISARGDHQVQISAFNADFEVKSDPETFKVVFPQPMKPGGVRLVIVGKVSENGVMTFELQELSELHEDRP